MRRDTDGEDGEKCLPFFYYRKSIGFTVKFQSGYKFCYKVSCSCSFTVERLDVI